MKTPQPIYGKQLRKIINISGPQLTQDYANDLVPPSLTLEKDMRSGVFAKFSFLDLVRIGIGQQLRILGLRKMYCRRMLVSFR